VVGVAKRAVFVRDMSDGTQSIYSRYVILNESTKRLGCATHVTKSFTAVNEQPN